MGKYIISREVKLSMGYAQKVKRRCRVFEGVQILIGTAASILAR
jgi:hypothetical protein